MKRPLEAVLTWRPLATAGDVTPCTQCGVVHPQGKAKPLVAVATALHDIALDLTQVMDELTGRSP